MIEDLIENIMGTSQPLMPKTTHKSRIPLAKPNKETDACMNKDLSKYKDFPRSPNLNLISENKVIAKKLIFSTSDENEPVLDDLVFQRSLKKPSFDAPRDETSSLSFEDSMQSLLSPISINPFIIQGHRNNKKFDKIPTKTMVNKQTSNIILYPEIFNIREPPILWKMIERILNGIKWILRIFVELFLFLLNKIW